MKIMKKPGRILLSILFMVSMVTGISAAAVPTAAAGEVTKTVEELEIGNYIKVGKYNGEPIVWRYMAEDELGKLIVSDRILCLKVFGEKSFWEGSFIRQWLNSDVSEDEAQWDFGEMPDYMTEDYKNEKGFLHESNFSKSERSILKTVTQWTMLNDEYLQLATNGIAEPYNAIERSIPGNPRDGGGNFCYPIERLPEVYSGAAHETSDTVFLLDEMQLYRMWYNMGRDDAAVRVVGTYSGSGIYITSYFLRTPSVIGQNCTEISSFGKYAIYWSDYDNGIRPAFYLDEANAKILSGSGTSEDPYVLDGKPEETNNESKITVFCNGSEILFDQSPVLENDRVLVPMRAIFEALGAEVTWEESTRTATASLGEIQVSVQIDNSEMMKNGEAVELDAPPRLIGERTLVPVRAISEGLGAVVEWNEQERQVIILQAGNETLLN